MRATTIYNIVLLSLSLGQFVASFSPRGVLRPLRSPSLKMASTLTDLCEISKEACEAVSPMLQAFYKEIRIAAGEDSTAKLKSDATFFTIADGIVQHMFIEYLFAGNKFGQIVGEEDDSEVNILKEPFYVDELEVPAEFTPLIKETLEKVKALSSKIDAKAFNDITAFVDPIDGTREFATGKGECVTILLGYNDPKGKPVAGIVYRPLTEPATWAAGAKSEGCVMGNLDKAKEPNPNGLLITDGKVSKWLDELIKEGGFDKIGSLASGNRALMLIEGKAGGYIRDTGGFAKWDTSGPEAVIEAYGGTMSKLPYFLRDGSLVSYTHLKTDSNLDCEKGEVHLSLSNAKDKDAYKALPKSYKDTFINATPDMIKEYSCVSGLVALNKDLMEPNTLAKIRNSMLKVIENGNDPLYN